MNLKSVSALLIAAVMAVPAFAADEAKEKKKGRRGQQNAATQLLKQLEPVGLTEDQITKIKELGKVAGAKMKEIRDGAGITSELTKKRAEVVKSMKDSDKKGKELAAAINKEAGYTEAQVAALGESNKVRMKFRADVVAMLTDAQKEKLPKQLQRAAKAGAKAGAKGKGKKRKDAE